MAYSLTIILPRPKVTTEH